MIQPKICKACLVGKPHSEFYAQSSNSDGCMGICKECHKARMIHRSRTNPKVQEYDRMRAKRPEVKRRIRDISAKWRRDNPDGYRAETAVNNAVRDGRLAKPKTCGQCGGGGRLHAHHEDYNKPLDVRWMCARCHHLMHAAERKAREVSHSGQVSTPAEVLRLPQVTPA